MADQTDVVRAVKAALEARGVDLSGPCGAFAITQRVAWQLRGEGAGLLDKPAGNNCGGYSVDAICYPDGRLVDCLEDAGGGNVPMWGANGTVDPGRYRPAVDPGDGGAPGPVTPAPAPAVVDVAPLVAAIAALEASIATLRAELDAARQQIGALAARPVPAYQTRLFGSVVVLRPV